MRLSDVQGDRVFEVLAGIIDPVSSIVGDDELRAAFKAAKSADTAGKVKAVAPLLLNKHRDDVVLVLSTIKGVSPEEYVEGMTLTTLLQDLFELVTDEVFADFLPSVTQAGGSSGSIEE